MSDEGQRAGPAAGHRSGLRGWPGVGGSASASVGGASVGLRRSSAACSSHEAAADRAPGDLHDGAPATSSWTTSSSRSTMVPNSPLVVMTSSPDLQAASPGPGGPAPPLLGEDEQHPQQGEGDRGEDEGTHGRLGHRSRLLAPHQTARRRRSFGEGAGEDGGPHPGHQVERPGQVVEGGEPRAPSARRPRAGGAGSPATRCGTPGSVQRRVERLVVGRPPGVADVQPARRR